MDEHASDLEASSHSQQSAGSGVSAAQIGAQTSESPLPFAVPVEGRTRGTGLKSYTYLPPRIDAERFQADIPAFAGPEAGPQAQNAAAAKTEAAADVDRSLALDPHKDQYGQCIKVFSPAEAQPDVVEEFLAFARNLFEQVFIPGGGAQPDAWSCERSAVPLESDERFLKYLQLHNYDLETAKLRLLSDLGAGTEFRCASQFLRKPNGSDVQIGCAFFERRHKMQGETKELYGIANPHSTGRNYLSYWGDRSATAGENGVPVFQQRPRFDKQELRRKWQHVVDAASLSNSRTGAKPHLRDLQAVLEEAMQLPSPDNTPGDGFIEIVQQSIGRIKELVRVGRRWLAKAHDALSTCKHLHSSTSGLPTIESLQALLTSARDLPLIVDEEAQIRKIVTEATEWRATARTTLDGIAVAATAAAAQSEADGVHQRTGAAATHLRPQVKIRLGNEAEEQDRPPKIPLASVNDLLLQSRRLNVALPELPELQAIFNQAMQISNQVGYFLDTATKRQRKRGKKSDISEAAQLQLEVARFPLEIPSAVHLNELVEQTQNWVADARAVLAAKSAALKRIEELVVQGEKLPFDVSDELEQLKAKRAQARMWMDRLKKSLPKTNRNTRRVDDRAKPKLDLKEMQQMISEGEQFDIQSRELDQMQSVVVSANEWVSRVREMLESGDAAEVEALNELLGEADEIPVVMEEVQLLRAQMEGIRWSEKLGKALAKKKPTLQEAQKLLKETQKIRNSLPASLRASNLLNIPREEEFKQAVTEAESATAKLKRYLPNGMVKPGVEVTKLRNLLAEAREKTIDLSEHFGPFEQAISDAEAWVQEHRELLTRVSIAITMLTSPVAASTTSNEPAVAANEEAQAPEEVIAEAAPVPSSKPMAIAGEENDEGPESPSQQQPLTVDEVQAVVDDAGHLPVSFAEIRALRALLADARAWMEEAERLCPKRNLKRRGDGPQPTLAQLRSLLERGRVLPFDLSEDIQRIEQTVGSIEAWSSDTGSKLTEYDTQGAQLFEEALALVKANDFDLPFLVAVFEKSLLQKTVTAEREGAYTWPDIKNETMAMEKEMSLIRKQADEFMVTLPLAHQIEAHEKLLGWVQNAHAVLHTDLWGDVKAEKVDYLLQDLAHVLRDSDAAKRALVYEGTLLDPKQRTPRTKQAPTTRVKSERLSRESSRATASVEPASEEQQQEHYDEESEAQDEAAGLGNGDGSDGQEAEDEEDEGDDGAAEADEEQSGDEGGSEQVSVVDNAEGETGVRTRKKQQVSWAQVFSQGGMIEGADSSDRRTAAETPTKARRGGKRGEKRRRASEPPPTASATPTRRGARGGKAKRGRGTPPTSAGPASGGRGGPAKRPRSKPSASSDDVTAAPEIEEPEPVIFTLAPYVRVHFMSSFLDLADLFARLLRVMLAAVDEANTWAAEVNRVLNTGKKMDMAEIEQLIAVATERGFEMKEKALLYDTCDRIQHWKKVARDILEGAQRLGYERMKDFVKEGERLGIDSDDFGELREHLKAAKVWLNKLHATGIERGAATLEQLQELLPEAESIKVDLGEQIGWLQQATSVYCLCRGPQSGFMIGCDSCDEWYHNACVNISKSGAERQPEYVCLRCLLKTQFINAMTNAACLVNRWQYPEEVQRAQDSRRQKSARKLKKELREKEKKESEFEAVAQVVTTKAESMQRTMDAPPNPQAILQSLSQDQLTRLKQADDELQEARTRYERALEEDQHVQAQEAFEKEHSSVIAAWMVRCQRVIWPQTAEQIQRSQPLGSGQPSPAVAELEAECAEQHLDRAEDVGAVLEALKLARWTYRCLYMLRIPPRLRELGALMEDFEWVKNCDEKIVKQLQQLHQRGFQWKTKLRKAVQGSAKKGLDAEKLSALLADAETIPIRTTLKQIARAALQNQSYRRSGGTSERRVVKSSSILGLPTRIDLPETSDEEEEEDRPQFVPSRAHESLWPAAIQVPKGSANSFNMHGEGKSRKAAQGEYGSSGMEPSYPPMQHRKSEQQPPERPNREEPSAPKRSMADLIPAGPIPYVQAAEDLLLQMAQQMATKRMRYDEHMLAGMMQHGYPEGVTSPELMQHLMLQHFHHPGALAAWGDPSAAARPDSREGGAGSQLSQPSATDSNQR